MYCKQINHIMYCQQINHVMYCYQINHNYHNQINTIQNIITIITSNPMNSDTRYDGFLSDLILLMQQALTRYITNKELDLNKFKQYFTSFTTSMTHLEEQFHSSRVRFSKLVDKLSSVCQNPVNLKKQIGLGLHNRQNQMQDDNLPIKQPSIRYKSNQKYTQITNQLNAIQQQQEDFHQNSKKRSGTAGGKRSQNFTIDFEQGRPMTGIVRKFEKYSVEKMTINDEFNTISVIPARKHITQLTNNDNLVANVEKRKSLYDDLERESQNESIDLMNLKYAPISKRSRSQHKWMHKFSKLF